MGEKIFNVKLFVDSAKCSEDEREEHDVEIRRTHKLDN